MTGISDDGKVFHTTITPIEIKIPESVIIETEAQKIKEAGSPLSKDEIINQLTYLSENGITLKDAHIKNLEAGLPAIPEAEALEIAWNQAVTEVLVGNPWMQANPLATFAENFLALSALLSRIKLDEAEGTAESLLSMEELAEDMAQLIKDRGATEFAMHLTGAIASFGAGAMSLAGGLYGKSVYSGNMGKMQLWNTTVQGAAQIAGSAEKFAQAIGSLITSALDAEKVILEHLQKVIDRKMNAEIESYRAQDEMISQLLQALQKYTDEVHRTFGFNPH